MSNGPRDIDDYNRPTRLRVRDASDLEGKTIPERDWLVPSVLVRRSITLFTGDGGVGKSLLSQCLQVAAALGKDWIGLPVPVMNSFGVYCEDDDDELDRRFRDICKYYGCRFRDLDGRVRYVSRVGEENELVRYNGRGDNVKPVKTALYEAIKIEIQDTESQLIILDTAGDVFGGNENIRAQVRSFVNIIRKLAIPRNGGVILNAHPSKSSMADGSNFSGSTAWHGSVRNRIFLQKPKRRTEDGDEDDSPTNDRILRIMKSNYSQGGGKIECKWQDGVIVESHKVAAAATTFGRLDVDRKVLDAAAWLVERGRKLGPIPDVWNSLVVQVRKLDSCKDYSFNDIKSATDRLTDGGKLVLVHIGRASKRGAYLRPSHLRYPGEDSVGATDDVHPNKKPETLL